jgi:hypothetical protein
LVFILVELCLAIGKLSVFKFISSELTEVAFIATNFKKQYNAAAILEWAVSFIFTFYVFSFIIDLIPAVRGHGVASKETEAGMEASDGLNGNGRINGGPHAGERNAGFNY